MVGAAAMRQVAEDASAHSAVEEGALQLFHKHVGNIFFEECSRGGGKEELP